jgi:hypothetical protein
MSGLAAVLSQWCEARRAGPGRPRDVTGSLAAWGGAWHPGRRDQALSARSGPTTPDTTRTTQRRSIRVTSPGSVHHPVGPGQVVCWRDQARDAT